MSIHSETMMSGVIAVLFTVVCWPGVLAPIGLPLFVLYLLPLVLTSLLQHREEIIVQPHFRGLLVHASGRQKCL